LSFIGFLSHHPANRKIAAAAINPAATQLNLCDMSHPSRSLSGRMSVGV
jgi:hypothetical protein